ncbi:hypothetical protein [Scytonema sp. NUACC26]|uniref:hypothetical protein n=1 Tax=Scytonema sp. NUACC26 TaxID=3140176 RepID=UPI0038B405AE
MYAQLAIGSGFNKYLYNTNQLVATKKIKNSKYFCKLYAMLASRARKSESILLIFLQKWKILEEVVISLQGAVKSVTKKCNCIFKGFDRL